MKRGLCVTGLSASLASLTALAAGCGGSPAHSSLPPPTSVLKSITITGNTSFTRVGETSKLTAVGNYSDGTTADISVYVQWTSQLIGVATVSSTGLVTTRGLGATYIYAQSLFAPVLVKSLAVTVTPAGTFAVTGWTREPGNGPLGGVRVLNTGSGQAAISEASGNSQGYFSLGGLTTGHFIFTKAGYEDAELDLAPEELANVPLQQVVRLASGTSLSLKLAPHDLDYVVAAGTHCSPCKMIRMTSPGPATLRLKLTWTDKTTQLAIWANGQMFPASDAALEAFADLHVGAGETMVYVGSLSTLEYSNPVSFTVSSTVVTPAPSTR